MRPFRFPILPTAAVLVVLISSLPAPAQDLTQAHRETFARCRQLQEAGDWLAAREVARQLAAEFSGATASQHRLAFVNELANLEQRLGNYDAALPGYEDCLATAREVVGEESVVVAQIKNNLAALHQVLGNFEEAEALSREALATRESLEGEGEIGTVPAMNNLAGLLWCIGDLGGAETLYREGISIRTAHLGAEALDTARSLANLGGLLYYQNEIDKADDFARRAAAIFVREAGPNHPDTLEALLFLGEIERALGQPEKALDLYTRVHEGRIAALGTRSHVEVAEAIRRLGDARRELGRYPEAREAYRESDTLYRELLREDHPDRQEGLYGLGLAALASGDREGAREAATICSAIEFRNFEAMLHFTDERQRLAYQDFFKSQHLLANVGDAEGVASFLLRQKGIVSDSLVAEAQLSKASNDPRVDNAQRALAAIRAEYRSAFLGSADSGPGITELEVLVRERERELRELTGARNLSPVGRGITVDDLRASLRDDEVLLDYLRYDRYTGRADFESRYGVAVISSDGTFFFDCCSAEEADSLIAEMIPFFGAGEADEAADRSAREVMEALYRYLIAPLSPGLTSKRSVIVSPEAALSFVPFACLVGPDGRFLIESHDLRYVSSARELVRTASPPDPARGALLVGNPAFKTGLLPLPEVIDRRGFLASFRTDELVNLAEFISPLEGAEREVDLLGPVLEERLGTPVAILKGIDATEEEIRSRMQRPHILHFATHGIYLPDALSPASDHNLDSPFVPEEVAGFQNPLFGSWLALAGSGDTVAAWSRGAVPDPERDGVFMANEAAELDLEGTLLVTLSACDTASGEATTGDGVLGLRRGFRIAGAENILSTLWPISDDATVVIMQQFYEELAVMPPAGSLSATQREWLVRIRDGRGDQPDDPIPAGGFYWAVNLAGPFLLGR